MIYKCVFGKDPNTGCQPQALTEIQNVEPEGLRLIPSIGRELFGSYSFEKKARFCLFSHRLPAGEVFGLGDKVAPLNRRNKTYTMINTDNTAHHPGTDALYKSFPFFTLIQKDETIGFFIDHTGFMRIDLDSEGKNCVSYEIKADGFVLYIMVEKDLKTVVKDFIAISGNNVAFPVWAMGYQQSRWGFITQQDFKETAEKFRKEGFPCDVLYLDIDHMDAFKIFTWNDEAFPEPRKMLKELREMGFKVNPIIDPGVKAEPGYEVFEEGKERYFLKKKDGSDFEGAVWPGRARFPDFFDQRVRKWWSEKVATWKKEGFAGFWNDMNEIAVFFTDEDIKKLKNMLETVTSDIGILALGQFGWFKNIGESSHEEEILHIDGTEHWRIRNAYGREMMRAGFEGLTREEPDERPFLISRAAYPGIQKYGGVWTGDNCSWWEHIFLEIIRNCTLSLCGVFYTGFDVGGFGDHATPELLVRFMQLGAFMPLFRNHAAFNTHPQDPWAFGKEYYEMMKQTVEMRYRYIPYLYSQYMLGILNQEPLLRILAYEYPADAIARSIEDEFLVGDSLLVAPIYRPGVLQKSIYFPERYLDVTTFYQNGQSSREVAPRVVYPKGWGVVDTPLNQIPHFLRSSRGLVTMDVQNYLFEKTPETYRLLLFGNQGEFYFYNDDGHTFQYLKRNYDCLRIHWSATDIQAQWKNRGTELCTKQWLITLVDDDGKVIFSDRPYQFE